jgi:hypothetical protein
MNLKLKKSELQALEKVLAQALQVEQISIEDKLAIAILSKFYKRIIIKLLDLKPKYNIQMDDTTALAFYQYYHLDSFSPQNFEDNLLLQICNNINQKYAL